MNPGGRKDDRQRQIRRIQVLVGFDQAGHNQHRDDQSHSDVRPALFRQILVHRRFLAKSEKALDDGDGCLHIPFLRQQTGFAACSAVVHQMKNSRGR